MADKNWQAGGKILIPAQATMCLIVTATPGVAQTVSDSFSPTNPHLVWEMLIGGFVVCAFLAAVGLWIVSALHKFAIAAECLCQFRPEQSQPRRSDDGSSDAHRVLQRPLSRDLWPRAL
jgi:hypothetical protein